MQCNKCPYYYHDGVTYNRCNVYGAEFFPEQCDCNLVNDDGTPNHGELNDQGWEDAMIEELRREAVSDGVKDNKTAV